MNKTNLSQNTRKHIKREMDKARIQGAMRYFQRLQAFLLLDKLLFEEVAEFVSKTPRTLYNWLSLFATQGLKGIRPKVPTGRKSKLTKVQRKQLKSKILAGPESNGYPSGRWTAAMIQLMIVREWGKEYAIKYIPELLKSLGLSYKKMELFSFREDLDARRKWHDETWPELARQAKIEGAAILFEDESTFRMWSRSAHSWGERGKRLKGHVYMNNIYQKVFGALDLDSGRFTFRQAKSLKANEFVAFLKYLLTRYKQKIYLVIDNGSSHKGQAVRDFLEKHDRLELVRLPVYSPQLNPIEKLWKQIKHERLHNRFFASEKAFRKVLLKALRLFQDEHSRVDGFLRKWRASHSAA